MNKPLRLLPVLLALLLVAAGKKEPEFSVRFYTETTTAGDDNLTVPVVVGNPPRKTFISRIANISENDIVGIYPFVTADNQFGCVFVLDTHGQTMLDTISVEKRGTALIALVNGRQVVDMLIDRRIPDGIVVIPRGLTVDELAMLKKHFKIITPPSSAQKQRPQ